MGFFSQFPFRLFIADIQKRPLFFVCWSDSLHLCWIHILVSVVFWWIILYVGSYHLCMDRALLRPFWSGFLLLFSFIPSCSGQHRQYSAKGQRCKGMSFSCSSGTVISLLPWSILWAVRFSKLFFMRLRKFPSLPSVLWVFNHVTLTLFYFLIWKLCCMCFILTSADS